MKNNFKSVVIVDDNEIIRMTLRSILRKIGFEVVGEAADGEKGLEVVGALRPDLVCLDIQMPKRGGLEVLAEMRAIQASIRVVMVTSHSDRETVQAAIERGAHGFIVKPFNQKQIENTLSRVLP